MTSLILPNAGLGVPRRRSSLLFHWRAADLSLDALTGQVGVFTRASRGTAIDALDRMHSVPHSAPRWTWINGEPALLLEDARQNGIARSNDIVDAAWAKANVTAVGITNRPDGLAKYTVLETATNFEHYVDQAGPATANNATVTISAVVEKLARDVFFLALVKKDGVTVVGSFFNITTGVVGGTSAGVTARMTLRADGSYRCVITVASVGTGASVPRVRVQCSTAGSPLVYLGDVTKGLIVRHVQYEIAPFESSEIITGAAAVTRAADDLSWLYNVPPRGMTVYAKFVDLSGGLLGATNVGVVDVGGNGSTPRFILYQAGSGWIANHSQLSIAGTGTPVLGATVELRGVLNENGSVEFGCAVNGGAESVSTDFTAPDLEAAWFTPHLYVNRYNGATIGFAGYRSVKVAAGARSLAQMQAVS